MLQTENFEFWMKKLIQTTKRKICPRIVALKNQSYSSLFQLRLTKSRFSAKKIKLVFSVIFRVGTNRPVLLTLRFNAASLVFYLYSLNLNPIFVNLPNSSRVAQCCHSSANSTSFCSDCFWDYAIAHFFENIKNDGSEGLIRHFFGLPTLTDGQPTGHSVNSRSAPSTQEGLSWVGAF